MAEEEVAVFSPDNGPLEIELVVGHRRRAGFEIDYNDSQDVLIQHEEGSVENADPTSFTLEGSPQNSDGSLLRWRATVERSSSTTPGQRWSVAMIIRQGGRVIVNGRRPIKEGTYANGVVAVRVRDKVRLKANEN
jgi:hypothetical protein